MDLSFYGFARTSYVKIRRAEDSAFSLGTVPLASKVGAEQRKQQEYLLHLRVETGKEAVRQRQMITTKALL